MRNRLTDLESDLRRRRKRGSGSGGNASKAASRTLSGVGPTRGGMKKRKARKLRIPSLARSLSTPVDYRIPGLVPALAQPTGMACWATVYTMLDSWRRQQSVSIESAVGEVGRRWLDIYNADTGLTSADKVDFVAASGLVAEPPMSHSITGWESLLREYGPLWVTGDEAPGAAWAIHARVVTAIRGDGTPEGTRFTIIDPAGGRTYEETMAIFLPKYEEEVRRTGNMRIQVLHWPRGAQRSESQARRARAPRSRARDDQGSSRAKDGGASVAVAIAGIAISYLSSNTGDVSWNLAQWRGVKNPGNDQGRAGPAQYQNQSLPLHGWPKQSTVFGADEIYLPLDVKWQYNGSSVANIEVLPGRANDAVGAGLSVEAHLMDDQNVYDSRTRPGTHMAAVKVTITYRFTNTVWQDRQARYEIWLYGDGTHYRSGQWL